MSRLLLVFLMFTGGYRWQNVKDSNHVSKRFVNHYGNFIGGYYQVHKSSQLTPELNPYIAVCAEGHPKEFVAESVAQQYVLSCPRF